MPNSFKLYPTHYSSGGENFLRGLPPLVTGLPTPLTDQHIVSQYYDFVKMLGGAGATCPS